MEAIMEVMVDVYYVSIPVMLIFFTAQLLCCMKGDRIRVKLLPACIIILAVFLTICICLADTFSGRIFSDDIDLIVLVYLITLFIPSGLIGVAVGWIAYGIYKWRNHPK